MSEAVGTRGRPRRVAPGANRGRRASGRPLRACAVGALALALVGLPVVGAGAPAIGRADPQDCAPGWVWSPNLNQCVFWLPTANGPGGPGGPGPR